jgi:hypothetical protein
MKDAKRFATGNGSVPFENVGSLWMFNNENLRKVIEKRGRE